MRLIFIIIRISMANLWSNKLRSVLTMLGIIIGVSSVIIMVALGQGAERAALNEFRRFGANVVQLWAVFRGRSVDQKTFTLENCREIMKGIPEVTALSPDINMQVQLKNGNKSARTQLQGVSAAFFSMRNFEIEAGRSFSSLEERRPRKVVVIGHKIVNDLFAGKDAGAIGKEVKINGKTYFIIGTMKERGASPGFNPDDLVMVPYTTAMKRFTGKDEFGEVSLQIADETKVKSTVKELTELMRRLRKIRPGQEDDFRVWSPTDALNSIETSIRIFTMLIAGTAGISLLVGGIGIMNIMLVTVTERTREIGLRKALGARRRDIMRQFLVESLVISFVGGFLGVSTGIGMSAAINLAIAHFMKSLRNFQVVISPVSILLAFGVCFVIGIFFGIYPARKAAKLDPIEALRHE